MELDRVLCIADGDNLTVGNPVLEGARVIGKANGEGKGKKTTVLKYKSKVRYARKTGHRQFHTTLVIDKIIGPSEAEEQPAKKVRRRKKE